MELDNDASDDATDVEYNAPDQRDKRVRRNTPSVWKHFVDLKGKVARCNYCDKVLSFKTTITNLKQHLRLKHPEIVLDDGEPATKNYLMQYKRVRQHTEHTGGVWEHFVDLTGGEARCNHCDKVLSCKSTITNLKQHLCRKHPEIVLHDDELAAKVYLFSRSKEYVPRHLAYKKKRNLNYPEDNDTSQSNTHESIETTSIKFSSEIWRHFEEEYDEAKCSQCKIVVPSNLDDMKNHLDEQHSSLLDEIIAKVQMSPEADSEDDNPLEDDDNTYTEILYLEDESGSNINYSPKKRKKPRLTKHEPTLNRVKKEGDISASSNEPVLKTREPAEDELDVFLHYIKILLKKVPKEASQKLHLDMINMIMNTRIESQPQHNIVIETVTSALS